MEETLSMKAHMLKKAAAAAFPYTLPIFAGFTFLGLTYGIYMNVSGFSFWYPMIMSVQTVENFCRIGGIRSGEYAAWRI